MKKLAPWIISLLIPLSVFSQSYVGWTTTQVNFREYASTTAPILSSLQPGAQIFFSTLDLDNDFYHVIDIATNTEGYVYRSFVKIGKQVKENEKGMFTPSGNTSSYNPEIEVYNNTDLTLTLKLGGELYSFYSQQKKSITISPGTFSYRASAPGVMPSIGAEKFESNMAYTWQFYIVTTRR